MTWNFYIITNRPRGVLYIGSTNNLKRRMYQHKNKVHPSTFSAKYNLDKLVYYESFETKPKAELREKRIKKWNRDWKIQLVEKTNPDWRDLYKDL